MLRMNISNNQNGYKYFMMIFAGVGAILCYLPCILNLKFSNKVANVFYTFNSQEFQIALKVNIALVIPICLGIFSCLTSGTVMKNISWIVRSFCVISINALILLYLIPKQRFEIIPCMLQLQVLVTITSFFVGVQDCSYKESSEFSQKSTTMMSIFFIIIIILRSFVLFDIYLSIAVYLSYSCYVSLGIGMIIIIMKSFCWSYNIIFLNAYWNQTETKMTQFISYSENIFLLLVYVVAVFIIQEMYFGQFVYYQNAITYITMITYSNAMICILALVLRIEGLLVMSNISKNLIERKSMLLRYISHEVRTPLNTVSIGLQLLSDALTSLKDQVDIEILDTVIDTQTSCESAVTILNGLLTFDKIDSGMLKLDEQACYACKFITSSLKPFIIQARHADISLSICVTEAVEREMRNKYLYADINKLYQVMRNLITNALKFTPNGGNITVHLSLNDSFTSTTTPTTTTTRNSTSNTAITATGTTINSHNIIDILYHWCQSYFPSCSDYTQNFAQVRSSIHHRSSFTPHIHNHILEESKVGSGGATGTSGSSRRQSVLLPGGVGESRLQVLKIEVIDDGAGISQENQKKLFKEIIQFNPGKLQDGGGSGLGLYICHGIVELHHGRISVHSEGEGKGSTFTLELPVFTKAIPNTSSIPPQESSYSRSQSSLSKIKRVFPSKLQRLQGRGQDSSQRNSSRGGRGEGGVINIGDDNDIDNFGRTDNERRVNKRVSPPAILFLSTMNEELQGGGCRQLQQPPPRPSTPSYNSNNSNSQLPQDRPHIIHSPTRAFHYSGTSTPRKDQGSDVDDEVTQRSHCRMEMDLPELITPIPKSSEYYHKTSNALFGCRSSSVGDCGDSSHDGARGAEFITSGGGSSSSSIGNNAMNVVHRGGLGERAEVLVVDDCENKSNSSCSLDSHLNKPPRRYTRALVVDDSATNRKMMLRSMKGHFDILREASDGLEALKKMEESVLQGDQGFDVVLLDYHMPVMDGHKAARELRARGYKGCIIGVSGSVSPEDAQAFVECGADYVLSKPIQLSRLKDIIEGRACFPIDT